MVEVFVRYVLLPDLCNYTYMKWKSGLRGPKILRIFLNKE